MNLVQEIFFIHLSFKNTKEIEFFYDCSTNNRVDKCADALYFSTVCIEAINLNVNDFMYNRIFLKGLVDFGIKNTFHYLC